jgi:serine/threonine-protein kinase RsbW
MKTTVTHEADSGAVLSLTLPAQPVNVAVVRQAMTGLAESLEIDARILADINMAVTEACTNVILHAYSGREENGSVEVEVRPARRRVLVVVRDAGHGFLPRPMQRDTSWRLGLPLIAALADGVEVTGGPDGTGTEVRMTFDLP